MRNLRWFATMVEVHGALQFKKERGRSPSATAHDAWEKRLAEGAAAFMRFKKEGRYE